MQMLSRAARRCFHMNRSTSSRVPTAVVRAGSSNAATRPTLKRVRHIMVSQDKEAVISLAEKELAGLGKVAIKLHSSIEIFSDAQKFPTCTNKR
eukprot:1160937-Pelagomonas_calceolata.AAC.13